MKNLEPDKVEQLLQFIQNKPAQRIVHFCDSTSTLITYLYTLCKTYDNEYFLNCCEENFYAQTLTQYANHSHIHIVKFTLERPKYMRQGIEYNYLIATLDFNTIDKKIFLQKCYPIIKTGGNILIIVPNSNYHERDTWRELLEEQYYVSTSIIDNLFENFDVIISKRMHGWGDK